MDDIERTVANGFAEMPRSLQMMLDRRDITLLQRSVNETMKRVQTLEIGQQELRKEIQELKTGQQRMELTLQQILTKLGQANWSLTDRRLPSTVATNEQEAVIGCIDCAFPLLH